MTESEFDAIDKMVRIHLAAFRRRLPAHVDFESMYQEGWQAALEAWPSLDESNGSIMSYLDRRIRGGMIDYLRRWMPDSRVWHQKRRQIEQAEIRAMQRLKRLPSACEIADEAGMTREEYERWRVPLPKTYPLDGPMEPMACRIADPKDVQQDVEEAEEARQVRELLALLPERKRMVVEMYYFGRHDMKSVAAQLDITESRVSQIVSECQRRLLCKFISRGWLDRRDG